MPRLNTTDGRAVQGTSSVSVAGVAVPGLVGVSANVAGWLDEAGSVLVYQDYTADPSNFLKTIDLDTSAITTVASHGANNLGAGNSVWASFLAAGANKGVKTNVSGFGPFPLAGPADTDEDGLTALVQNYVAGQGMQCYDETGALVATWDVQLAPGYVIRCRNNLVAYPATGNVWHLRDLTDGTEVSLAQRDEAINVMVPARYGTRILVLERSERLTLREATAAVGYVLTEDDTFTPDIIELTAGVFRVAYASTAGEGATTLRMIDLNIGNGTTTNWTSASGTLVSSVGPTLKVTTLPASGGSGLGLANEFLDRHPFTDKGTGILSQRFGWPWVRDVNQALSQPVDLASQVTGILPAANGGTGTPNGTTVINGGNILAGTTPLTALEEQDPATLVGRGSASAGSPQVLTLGAGLSINGTVISVTVPAGSQGEDGEPGPPGPPGSSTTAADIAGAGYWSPLMTGGGATSEMILTSDGDAIMVWTPL